MFVVRKELTNRFDTGRTMPGTRRFHFLLPDNSNCIPFKRISDDPEFAGEFSFCEQTPLAKDRNSLPIDTTIYGGLE